MDTFSSETLIPLLSQHALFLLAALVGLVWYGALADRTIFEGRGKVRPELFAPADVWVALFLVALFVGLVLLQLTSSTPETARKSHVPDAGSMVAGVLLSEVLFVALVAGPLVVMRLRGVRLVEAFGLGRAGAGTVVLGSFGLLLLALPIITETLELSRLLLAGAGYRNHDAQDAVRFLSESPSLAARLTVGIQAMFFAPVQEELIFRGFLYGVARRYLGPAAGLVLVSLLFAAIHLHAPSFAGLFVLAACLTLAYEWSGSLLVPMAMHSMFNALTVIQLLLGGSVSGG